MRRLGALLVAALILASCGGGGSSSPSPSGGSGGASTSSPSASASAPSASASAVVPGDSASASPAIAIDPSLLDVLPAQLDGLDRQHDPSIEAGSFDDPTLPGIATAGITALYIDPATAQFAFVAVIRLRDARLDDAQFRAWRDTFDAAACAQAGAVGGHAEATIGGHDTFIGTCTGGLTTYHTILTSQGLLVSISAVGDRRLGEKLVAALPS